MLKTRKIARYQIKEYDVSQWGFALKDGDVRYGSILK